MELETLFTASKWDILQHLAEQPYSPLELSERSSTSLANISQQLRLLEMAGLVTSERVPNRDRGLPRIKYRLASDQGYFIATANEFVEKKLFKLTTYNKAILRIWFYDDPSTRLVLEKAFWRIEPLLKKVHKLGVLQVSGTRLKLCVVSDQLSQQDFPDIILEDLDEREVCVSFELRTAWPKQAHILYES
jgi:predicted transcriptional regulator